MVKIHGVFGRPTYLIPTGTYIIVLDTSFLIRMPKFLVYFGRFDIADPKGTLLPLKELNDVIRAQKDRGKMK